MSHDNFQPPEFDEPEKDDDDRMYGALSDLASIDTSDINLRDHPKAYEVLDRLMTHAYAEGRKDQRAADAAPELVEHLQAIVGYADAPHVTPEKALAYILETARAALAKARGEA